MPFTQLSLMSASCLILSITSVPIGESWIFVTPRQEYMTPTGLLTDDISLEQGYGGITGLLHRTVTLFPNPQSMLRSRSLSPALPREERN